MNGTLAMPKRATPAASFSVPGPPKRRSNRYAANSSQSTSVDVSRASGVRVDVTEAANGDGNPPSRDHALLVYRIAQEALRNVSKHAGVAHCRMHIDVSSDEVQLEVKDGGKGFVADDSARGRGLGLISMAERARLADGRLEIWSRPGEGTTVRAVIPRQPH